MQRFSFSEDIIGTAVHVKCLEMKPERPDSDSLDGECHGRRMPRSQAAGWRPGGGAKRRFMDAEREDAKSAGVRDANAEDQDEMEADGWLLPPLKATA